MVIHVGSHSAEVMPWDAQRHATFRQALLDELLDQLAWTRIGTVLLSEALCVPPLPREAITEENHKRIQDALLRAAAPMTDEEIIAGNAALKEGIRRGK